MVGPDAAGREGAGVCSTLSNRRSMLVNRPVKRQAATEGDRQVAPDGRIATALHIT